MAVTALTIQDLGDPDPSGGRRSVVAERTALAFWKVTSNHKKFPVPRGQSEYYDVVVTFVAEDECLGIDTEVNQIKKGDHTYQIVQIRNVPEDLGIDNFKGLALKRIKA